MATFSLQEPARYSSEDYASASIETQDKILTRQAEILKPEQERNALNLLDEAGKSIGITARSISINKPKTASGGTRVLTITFTGTRSDGGSVRRTAEVAFLNEYGVGKRMSARRFISRANEDKADECAEIAADLFAAFVADQITF